MPLTSSQCVVGFLPTSALHHTCGSRWQYATRIRHHHRPACNNLQPLSHSREHVELDPTVIVGVPLSGFGVAEPVDC
eukprot:scaffold175314_cov37-Prasinocladus_malaysianus.AAC.2